MAGAFGSRVVGGGYQPHWTQSVAPMLFQLSQQFLQQSQQEDMMAKQQEMELARMREQAALQEESAKNIRAYDAGQDRYDAAAAEKIRQARETEALDAFRSALAAVNGGPAGGGVMFQNPMPQGLAGSQQPGPQGMPQNPFTGQLPAMQQPQPAPAPAASPASSLNTEQRAAMAIATLAIKGSPQAAQVASDFVSRGLLSPEKAAAALEVSQGIRESADQASRAGVAREGLAVEREGQAVQRRGQDISLRIAEQDNPNIGTFMPMMDDQGRITGAWNPKTGDYKQPPVEGARRSPKAFGERQAGATLQTFIEDLDTAEALAGNLKGNIGPVEGRVTKALSNWKDYPPQVQDLLNLTERLSAERVYQLSGKQINEREMQTLRSITPRIEQGEGKFKANLKAFRKLSESLLAKYGATSQPQMPGEEKPVIKYDDQGRRIQ